MNIFLITILKLCERSSTNGGHNNFWYKPENPQLTEN